MANPELRCNIEEIRFEEVGRKCYFVLTAHKSDFLNFFTAKVQIDIMLGPSFLTGLVLSALFYFATSSVGVASPIVISDYRDTKSTLSARTGTATKDLSTFIPRNHIAHQNDEQINNSQVYSSTGSKKSSTTAQQDESSLPEVIPKDPNGFFHLASLNRFKSSVASFKAWQRLNVVPDATTLARNNAQDVASKLDYFIDKITTRPHLHHAWHAKSDVPWGSWTPREADSLTRNSSSCSRISVRLDVTSKDMVEAGMAINKRQH
ncbi:uncharacterized protein VP01_2234g3 [Puccinia sorghi]|uniref:Uncharacterized protein n=1 Tax=Puccinia sorghi TaxID=27349 RepID=A0A0L6V996_9BASI|nr:uncharacterized protein VP01_2234g3 [Puccinia sorghi]